MRGNGHLMTLSTLRRRRPFLVALLGALLLAACGGGASDSAANAGGDSNLQGQAGAPVLLNDAASDGFNWFNYRRRQMGVPALSRNSLVDAAAAGHANYQKLNNVITHTQIAGQPGFTGSGELDRLTQAGYVLNLNNAYAFGEVISATTQTSGFAMAEELIAAIYHRFVIFNPVFKEAGSGAATVSGGYTYFTTDLVANNGYGPGLASGTVAVYPFDGQQNVALSFFSDYETPDPVAAQNEVGYPVSVHANAGATLTMRQFAIAPRGGLPLTAQLLTHSSDAETPSSAAALIPLTVLSAGTSYVVTFSGELDNVAIARSWSFTTR